MISKDDFKIRIGAGTKSTSLLTKKWTKSQIKVLIVKDSLISWTDERRITQKSNVKVRFFPGETMHDIEDYLKPLFKNHHYFTKTIQKTLFSMLGLTRHKKTIKKSIRQNFFS